MDAVMCCIKDENFTDNPPLPPGSPLEGFGFNLESIKFDLSYLLADEFDPHADMLKFSISGSF